MMDDAKNTYKVPTPQDSLESQIMDPNFPKNEREWWAAAEITRLRAEVEALKAENARLTPMMRLEPTGWEFLDWIEPDFLTSIPQGTQLYMIDAARAAQGVE